jgi:hypothetical protein
MKFLARTQFGKRLVLLDALDASEVIPPETGDGQEENDGVKTSAREAEEMPSGSIRIQDGSKIKEHPDTEAGDAGSANPTGGATSEVSRLKRATKRGFGFLSVDQEMRLREASTGARDPEGIVYRAYCQARKLCQGLLTTDPMLITVAVEISVQIPDEGNLGDKRIEEGYRWKEQHQPNRFRQKPPSASPLVRI